MSKIVLKAEKRAGTGKGAVKRIRREGFLPGIVYGANKEPETIAICMREFKKAYAQKHFFSSIFDLEGLDSKDTKYIVKDMQYHPVSDEPLHIDFMRIAKGQKVTIKASLNFINQELAPGLKHGGVLNVLSHEIDIVCDIDHIPDHIDIDMTGAEFHHSIHAHDVKLPDGVSFPTSIKNYTIATVVAPTIIKEAATESAAAPTEAPAATEEKK